MPSRTFRPLRDTFQCSLFSIPSPKKPPPFLLLETRQNLYSSSPYWRIEFEKKYQRGGDVFSKILLQIYSKHLNILKKDYNFDLALGGLIHHHLESLTYGEGRRKSQSHDTKSILRSAENWRGGVVESWWRPFKRNLNVSSIFPLDSVTKLITRDRKLAFPKSWPNWTRPTFEKSIPLSLSLSPLSYVSFVIFQRVAISTDFSFFLSFLFLFRVHIRNGNDETENTRRKSVVSVVHGWTVSIFVKGGGKFENFDPLLLLKKRFQLYPFIEKYPSYPSFEWFQREGGGEIRCSNYPDTR